MGVYIALDVGGTSVSAALVSSNGRFVTPVKTYKANSNSDKETILNNLAYIIKEQYQLAKTLNIDITGIGIGFPGPFDYENGISLIKNIGKYDSIYGVNINKELHNMLGLNVDIRFCNDADLYCMGECVFGVGKYYNRCMCICIGTGIGSGFFADGKLVKSSPDVPENGWIYNTPYRDGIVDEYLSATGIRRMMLEYPETARINSVKELAESARAGLPRAIEIFNEFGRMLSEVIPQFAISFGAECLILGGDVSRSCDLFDKPLTEKLAEYNIKVVPSKTFADNTLLACSLLFDE
ncbi:MAG TPA: ROK family protein [Clostridiales bacterium]|nr:ROK family protein [Clostridiales bacterium]